MRRASCSEVCRWIVENVPNSYIQNGFKRALSEEQDFAEENPVRGEVDIVDYMLENNVSDGEIDNEIFDMLEGLCINFDAGYK